MREEQQPGIYNFATETSQVFDYRRVLKEHNALGPDGRAIEEFPIYPQQAARAVLRLIVNNE
jgi:hypothetical protein